MALQFHKAPLEETEEHCVCEHADTCGVPEINCYHKGIHNRSRGSMYVHPCKLPTYCRHTGMNGVTCKTVKDKAVVH